MRALLAAALCLGAGLPAFPSAAPPARAALIAHVCTLLLLDAEANARGEGLNAAKAQLEREGCQAGDPLVVIATGVSPAELAGALCRRGAGVQVSEKLDGASDLMQVDCEYPGLRSSRRGGG
ncbi:hypothetical protein [Rubritepida flocculans]|uniref:hypothetical protein n=1 Tax=Rubritepida flocculans TaxID=182403 RepID=UPI0004187E61|nr:hypothetical protein [Rubritepida flocculans]